jgi:hypothetical protein
VQDSGLASRAEAVLAAESELEARTADLAEYAAGQVIQISPSAPEGGAALTAARWRALACAAQQVTCVSEYPYEGAERAAAAITKAGWAVSVPQESNGTGATA